MQMVCTTRRQTTKIAAVAILSHLFFPWPSPYIVTNLTPVKGKATILPHPLPHLSSLSLTVYRANTQRKGLPLQRGCHSQTLTLSPSRSIQIFTTSSPLPTSHPSTHLSTPHSPTIIFPPSLHHHYNSNRTNDNHHNKNNIPTLNPTLKKKVRYSRKTYLPSQGLKIPDFGDDVVFTSGARTRHTQSIGKV